MVALTLKYSNLAQHQDSIFKQLQAFRKDGQLCDVVLKSRSGTEHKAHKAVVCAASVDLRNMLLGSFAEAHQVRQGQPVQIAASDAVVFALLEYIYGGQLQVELEDSLELLRLADAYGFPELTATIEAGLCTALQNASVATALKVLRHARDLHELTAKCEKKVATDFETCINMDDFLELSAGQLGRILRREDLHVSREEVVVQGLFNWFSRSNDRGAFGALLQNIDFQCLSSSNLTRLRRLSASIGPVGHDLQREVGEALQVQKKRSAANVPWAFRPKRRCLKKWSPQLGASLAPRKVLPYTESLCWHDESIYYANHFSPSSQGASILRWKPGDAESKAVAGRGARVTGVNDLGSFCKVSVSPEGIIFVVDSHKRRLLSFRNGSGKVVLRDVAMRSVFCAPNRAVYIVTKQGAAVQKLVGATLQPLISSKDLPAQLQFIASGLFVTKDQVIYVSDVDHGRILRIKPGEAEPVVVGEVPNKESSALAGLFVTEDEKIYVADTDQQKVWAFHIGDAAWTEVLKCHGELEPVAVLVQGRSLYVSMMRGDCCDFDDSDDSDDSEDAVFEYLLPLELQLG
eukprot:Skav200762  [mRNA]  locus=scaffold2001:150581:152305:- [translate_table: standard]